MKTFYSIAAILAFSLGVFSFANSDTKNRKVASDITPSVQLPANYALAWQDDFSSQQVDKSKWSILTGQRDNAMRTTDAVTTVPGFLKITTYTENKTHYTGYLSTQNIFETTYGFFESKIRFHGAPGTWCAFWLQTPTIGNPMKNPAKAGVEIDIVEHRAINKRNQNISNFASINLHWDGYKKEHQHIGSAAAGPKNNSIDGNWHTYAVLWTDKEYKFYLDGKQVWQTAYPISKRSQFIYLTCEIRNHDWAGLIPTEGYLDRAHSKTGMDVQWVRVWKTK